eukprot:1487816-Pyramimonas_sp.AAC.1
MITRTTAAMVGNPTAAMVAAMGNIPGSSDWWWGNIQVAEREGVIGELAILQRQQCGQPTQPRVPPPLASLTGGRISV